MNPILVRIYLSIRKLAPLWPAQKAYHIALDSFHATQKLLNKKRDARNVDSIKAQIIHDLADKRMISGNHDFNVGLQRILKATIEDKNFDKLLGDLAAYMLFLFPKKEEEKQRKWVN